MNARHAAREAAVQALYLSEIGRIDPETAVETFFAQHLPDAEPSVREFAARLVLGVHADQAVLDALIAEHSANWRVERLAVTDRDGRYEFTRMPAGRFVIGVTSGPARAGRAPRTFLPGVAQVSAAGRVIVGAGERTTVSDFRLPATVKYVAVNGLVLDADTRPAEGAQVYVKGPAEGDRIVGEPVAVDFMGRFAVAVLAGTEHAIFAERRRGTRIDSSEQVRIPPGDAQNPIRLVLRRRY